MIAERVEYQFRADWVSHHIPYWETIFKLGIPRDKALEIGAFEGRASCWFLDHFLNADGSLYCIDTWEGGHELIPAMTRPAYELFLHNTKVAKKPHQKLVIFKKKSLDALVELLATGHAETFDLIYVDGCHQAQEVLSDAVMSWHLLRQGGILLFDDYTMDLQKPIDERPKAAIDALCTIFNSKIHTLMVRDQYAIRKTKP